MIPFVQSAEGLLLRLVAAVLGVRVTSWMRTVEHNASVGGLPNSKHLWGGAIDVGMEVTEGQRAILRKFGQEVDERVKRSHWHYEVDGRAAPVVLVVLGLAGAWIVAETNRRGH